MTWSFLILLTLAQSFLLGGRPLSASDPLHEKDRVLLVVQQMEAVFQKIEDYRCDVEQIFYREGVPDEHYRFRFYFKKIKKIRVDFLQPYPELSLFYQGGDDRVTILPLRFLRLLKLRLSIDNPRVQTPAGQRLDQTDMGYFIDFVLTNLRKVPQREDEFEEGGGRIKFLLWAKDYIKGTSPEKYRVTVSTEYWLPVRIERYDMNGKLLEAISIEDYVINTPLEDQVFMP